MIRFAGRSVLHGVAALMAAGVVILGIAFWRLGGGPVSLSFLSPYLASALSVQAKGYSLAFEDTVLALGSWPHAIDIRLTRVRVVDDAGRLLLAAPEVSVDLALGRLLDGEVVPVGLTAVRPLLRLMRGSDGRITLGSPDAEPETGAQWNDLLGDLGPDPDPASPFAKLAIVAVAEGSVAIEDQTLGVAWRAEHVDIEIHRTTTGITLNASARLPFGDPFAHLDMSMFLDRDADAATGTLRVGGVHPRLAAQLAPDFAPLAWFDVAGGGTLDFRLGTDGRVKDASFEVWTGAGTIDPGGLFGAPRPIKGLVLQGHAIAPLTALSIDSFAVDMGEGRMSGSAQVTGLDADSHLDLSAFVENVTIADILGFWPPALGTGARAWLAEHLTAARAPRADVHLDAEIAAIGRDETPLHGLTIKAEVEDARLDYLPPLPPGEAVRGHVAIGGYAVEVTGLSGTVDGLTVADGRIDIPSLDGGRGLSVTLPIVGPLSRALAIAAEPSLGLDSVAELAQRGAEAQAAGTLTIDLPRLDRIERTDVGVGLDAHLEALVLPDIAPGLAITGGAATVTLAGSQVAVAGDMAINGVPLSVVWNANAADGSGWRAHVTGTLDDAARAALGLDLGPRAAGTVGGDLTIEPAAGGAMRFGLDADATAMALEVSEIPWSKPVGAAARLAAAWTEVPDGSVVVESLRFDAPDAIVDGGGTIASGGASGRLDVRRFKVGRNDVRGSLAFGADGYDVDVAATEVDLSPQMENVTGQQEAEPLPSFRLNGTADRLYLRPDQALANVTVAATVADDRWVALDLRATMPGGAPLTVAISPGQGVRTFGLNAGDAGDALRLFDVFDTASGGRLEIGAIIDDRDPERPAKGRLIMHEFTIHDAPILGKLLALGSFAGIGALLSCDGIPFVKANIPFEKRGALVTIAEARAWGGALGLNGEGTIDVATVTLDLHGTLVPAYTINSMVGWLPLFGELLVGGKGEGLFAATYAVKGPRADPEVLVNPLATLAPGFLRNLFEFGDGTATPAEATPSEAEVR